MYIAAFVEYVAFLDVMRTMPLSKTSTVKVSELGLTNACTAFVLVS